MYLDNGIPIIIGLDFVCVLIMRHKCCLRFPVLQGLEGYVLIFFIGCPVSKNNIKLLLFSILLAKLH
jgi:hypothetical protein